jgi:hypothetical protein
LGRSATGKNSGFMTLTAALIKYNNFFIVMYERVKQLETAASPVSCVLKLLQDVRYDKHGF